MATQQKFPIEQLLLPSAFPHAVSRITLIETHISWIILTGEFAYKIKKPVKFDFVDYSSLELRHQNCENELALNSRYSTGIYLDVVPIVVHEGRLRVLSPPSECTTVQSEDIQSTDIQNSEPVEYAVRMKEFDQQAILANRLKKSLENSSDPVPVVQLDQFARNVARFHLSESSLEITDVTAELDKLHTEVQDNFTLLRKSLGQTPQADQLERIAAWSESEFDRLSPLIRDRIVQGFVKRCHGDLHLNNIIFFNDHLVPFDGIEFNQHLQEIDTLNEVAFTYMDLVAHGHERHANRFLNAYLEETNCYSSLELFRFFAVYRAMVRAKVAWINCQVKSSTMGHASSWLKTDSPDSDTRVQPVHPWDHYLDYADSSTQLTAPDLTITFGFSGSGKSTVAMQEVENRGAICLRSDVERMRMKDQPLTASLYAPETTDTLYRQLMSKAEEILNAGFPVVIDATFLSKYHREWAQKTAAKLKLDYRILACDANFGELCARIQNRKNDPSEATIAVLQEQMEQYDPLTEEEQRFVLTR